MLTRVHLIDDHVAGRFGCRVSGLPRARKVRRSGPRVNERSFLTLSSSSKCSSN